MPQSDERQPDDKPAREETIVSMSDTARRTGNDVLPPGTKLGKYQLRQMLGRGGMGTVYLAVDMVLKREVALKILPQELTSDEQSLKRFIREAQLAARLSHVNAVTVFDVNRDQAAYFIAMELVRGASTDDLIKKSGALPVGEATRIVADACRALTAAHDAGLIHRDIKPANILRAKEGTVKLTDFGLAKLNSSTNVTITDKNVVLGTPHYISPEQCQNEPLDRRSDLYSLGATYYALLTGASPYAGGTAIQVLFAHCSKPVPDPRESSAMLPIACTRIVQKAMAKKPEDRYQNAAEMLADLELLMDTKKAAAPAAAAAPAEEPSPEFAGLLDALAHETKASPVKSGAKLQELPQLPGMESPKRRRGNGNETMVLAGIGAAAVVVLLILGWFAMGWMRGSDAATPHAETAAEAMHTSASPTTTPATAVAAAPSVTPPKPLAPPTAVVSSTPTSPVDPTGGASQLPSTPEGVNPPTDPVATAPTPTPVPTPTPTPAPTVTFVPPPARAAPVPLAANDPIQLQFNAAKAAMENVQVGTPEFGAAIEKMKAFDQTYRDSPNDQIQALCQQARAILDRYRPGGPQDLGNVRPPNGGAGGPGAGGVAPQNPAQPAETPQQPVGPKTPMEKQFDIMKLDLKSALEARNQQRLQFALSALTRFEREFRTSKLERLRELASEARQLVEANKPADDTSQQSNTQNNSSNNQPGSGPDSRPTPPPRPRRP